MHLLRVWSEKWRLIKFESTLMNEYDIMFKLLCQAFLNVGKNTFARTKLGMLRCLPTLRFRDRNCSTFALILVSVRVKVLIDCYMFTYKALYMFAIRLRRSQQLSVTWLNKWQKYFHVLTLANYYCRMV